MPGDFQIVDTTVKKITPLPDDEFKTWAQSQETSVREGSSPETNALRDSLNLN